MCSVFSWKKVRNEILNPFNHPVTAIKNALQYILLCLCSILMSTLSVLYAQRLFHRPVIFCKSLACSSHNQAGIYFQYIRTS